MQMHSSYCVTDPKGTIVLECGKMLEDKNDFDTERIKVVFDSKKVTDHHAIIPTIDLSE